MRIFLAVFPSPEAQRAAFAAIERWKRQNDGVSWVKRDNLHYTLRFLGELDEAGVTRATGAAPRARAMARARGGSGGAGDARVTARALARGARVRGRRATVQRSPHDR